MNLGQAVYRKIAGSTPKRRDESWERMLKRAQDEAGGVSQLARAIGVARTTVQRWNKGARPTDESIELLRAVTRRADMSDARARRLATTDQLIITGTMKGRPGGRTINLTPHLAAGTMGRAVEAYLRGASAYDLHVIVWSGITDKHYRWMFQPPGGLAQQGPAAVQEHLRDAFPSGGGAMGGGGGPAWPYGEEGGPDEFDDYPEDLLDLAYELDVVDDNDSYEFNVSGAR